MQSLFILHFLIVQWSSITLVHSPKILFQSVRSLIVQHNGIIFLVDERSSMLHKVQLDGDILGSVGGKGMGDTEFDIPTDISSSFLLDVYVTDFNNRRIQHFDKNLNYIQTYDASTITGDPEGFQPRACAVSTQGDLFIIDVDGNRVLKVNRRGRLLVEFGTYKDGAGMLKEPADIAVSPADEVFVLDMSKIIVYDRFGNYLRTISLPAAEWKNIQASDRSLLATATDQIFLQSLVDGRQTTIARSSIAGIPSNEQFVDAAFVQDTLVILSATTLYSCSVGR